MREPAISVRALLIAGLIVSCGAMPAAAESSTKKPTVHGPTHLRSLPVEVWPAEGPHKLIGAQPSFVKVWAEGTPSRLLEFSFNTDATEISFHPPKTKANSTPPKCLELLLAEESRTCKDGVVVLSALDARVVGKQAKLETHPGSHRIGFWNNPADYVVWDYKIPAGKYRAELTYSRATRTGTRVAISLGDQTLPLTLKHTGSWYHYRTVPLGEVELAGEKATRVEVRVEKIINGGVMNLKAIVLTPIK